jgi:hypothetical protein
VGKTLSSESSDVMVEAKCDVQDLVVMAAHFGVLVDVTDVLHFGLAMSYIFIVQKRYSLL